MDSITIGKVLECEDLNIEVEEVQDPEEVVEIIKRYEDIIKMKNREIINVAYYQGQVFKRFKEGLSLLNSSLNQEFIKYYYF